MNAEDVVFNLVALSGGQVVGRTRLQKEAYLLDRCGANLQILFTYHHYGPYSFELADGWANAAAEDRITITEKSGRHGVSYSTFSLKRPLRKSPDSLGDLRSDDARDILNKMRGVSDIVLELAATIVFLWQKGYGKGAVDEVVTRKPKKASEERITKALALLQELGLSEQVVVP